MKRIAIVGANSFLARNLIEYIGSNHKGEIEMRLYDRDDGTYQAGYPYITVDFDSDEGFEAIDFDVDSVLIFTGLTGQKRSMQNPYDFIKVNEIMLLHLLDACRRQKDKPLIIYPSSRLIFAADEQQALKEDAKIEMNSVYAVTKYAAEQYLRLYERLYGMQYVILRMCTPFGTIIPGYGSYGTFEIFQNQAEKEGRISVFGDGSIKKTFTDIRDICEAFYRVIQADSIKERDYNIGGQALTLDDIAKKIAKDNKVPVEYNPWPEFDQKTDGGTVVLDSGRFDSEFHFSYRKVLEKSHL